MQGGMFGALWKGGELSVMVDYITFAGFMLAVFGTGVAVGKLVEKIERLDRRNGNEEHKRANKNNCH